MKYNMMQVTFWFDEVENFKEYQSILDSCLSDSFTPFNLIGIPSTVDPIIPRISSTTLGGHSTFNMSKINVQFSTKFDNDFVNDFDKCFKYVREKIEKIFDVLVNSCHLKILYSAIHLNSEYEEKKPIEKIINIFFNNSFNDRELNEIGVRFSEKLANKFYYIFTINDAKVVSFTRKINQGEKMQNIIIPLISEKDVTIEKNVLSFDLEINDKYAFNVENDYNSNIEVLIMMFDKFLNKNNELFENIVKGKIL